MPRLTTLLTACLFCVLALPATAADDPRDPVASVSEDCAAPAVVADTGDALPALALPGDDLREDRVYAPCTITKSCAGGGSVSCSSPGGQFGCSYGFESCTTWDGCGGSRLYVTCGFEDRTYCSCSKTQSNCPPEPSCPSGRACHFDSECGDGVCANRRCLCPF